MPSHRQQLADLEPSLLSESNASAWAGFRLGVFRATPHFIGKHEGEHPVLAMVVGGRTRARIASRGQDWDICPGQDTVGLFAPRLDVNGSHWVCEGDAERLVIELNLTDLQRTGDLDAMRLSPAALRQDLNITDAMLASLLRLMANEVRQGSPHGALYATSLSLGLAAYLSAAHVNRTRAMPRERGALTLAQRAQVLDLITQGLAGDLGLDELAGAAGVGRFHFVRLFKNSFGVTPHRFVMRQRAEAARRLLEKTGGRMVDIAAATGFASQSHLCTVMRREFGQTPGCFRRVAGS